MTITVGIAGLTSKFASLLASSLLQHPEVSIKGYCSTPSKVPASISSSPRVTLIQGDAFATSSSLYTSVKDCDVVVCCYLGDNKLMIDGQKLLIDACDDAGVPRYVASDWCLDYDKLDLGDLPSKDPMKHVKAYLETKKSLKGVHVLVGGFMEVLFAPMFNMWDAKSKTFKFWGSGTGEEEVWWSTTYKNSADYTTAVCLDKTAVGTFYSEVAGGRSSVWEIAAAFESAYGVKPSLERLGSLEDMYEKMHVKARENPENKFSWMFMYCYYYTIKTMDGLTPDNSRYPNIKPVDFEHFFNNLPMEKLPQSYFGVSQDI